jgi:hypothetical protein
VFVFLTDKIRTSPNSKYLKIKQSTVVLIGLKYFECNIPLRWLSTRAFFWLIILNYQGLSGHEASSDHCGWLQRRVSARQKRQVTLAPCNVTLLDILERSTHLNNHSVYFSWLETIYETTFEENLCRTNITKFSAHFRWNFRVLQPEKKKYLIIQKCS